MADNQLIDNSDLTDFTAATDDVAGVHFQKVKIVDGTADGTAAIPGDATNGLKVNVAAIVALPAGTNEIGKVKLTDGTDTALVDASGNLQVNIAGVTATAAGASIFRSIDLDETEEAVKATAGTVFGMWVTNTATSTRWVKFYNATAANVTVGTTTPVVTIGIPGNTSDDIAGVFNVGGPGMAFDTAITVAATTGVADADTGAPAANDVIVNITYE